MRSSCALLLSVCWSKRKTLGIRSFCYTGLILWHDLPSEERSAKDINCFKSLLKIHFLKIAMICKYSYFGTARIMLYIL